MVSKLASVVVDIRLFIDALDEIMCHYDKISLIDYHAVVSFPRLVWDYHSTSCG